MSIYQLKGGPFVNYKKCAKRKKKQKLRTYM